jgi:very-short-patch-repair endonuclease
MAHTASMTDRLSQIAALAATQHSVVSSEQLLAHGIDASNRRKWERRGLISRLGPRSFAMVGSTSTLDQKLAAGVADLAGHGLVAGRAAGRLYGLDGFSTATAEFLVPRAHRNYTTDGLVCSTTRPLTKADVVTVQGFRCLTAERMILESPLFHFDRGEIENAIDSAIRLRLVAEQRLRTRAIRDHRASVNGSRLLLDALVDAGGESRLERWFLRLLRQAGIARPALQRTYREGTRVVARVDFCLGGNLVVEVSGHGTHASRRQRQTDAQRHTELTLRGLRVLTFTYEDVRDRPSWVIARLREALAFAA